MAIRFYLKSDPRENLLMLRHTGDCMPSPSTAETAGPISMFYLLIPSIGYLMHYGKKKSYFHILNPKNIFKRFPKFLKLCATPYYFDFTAARNNTYDYFVIIIIFNEF